jgi:hypothetical protein
VRWAAASGAAAIACALVGCLGEGDPVPASDGPAGAFPAPPRSRAATVWAVGDADASEASKRVARLIARDRPTRLLYLGDVYHSGTAQDFRSNFDDSFGVMKRRTLPTPGNHDWPNHTEGYDPYWAAATGRRPPSFYSLRTAGWQILSLNSEEPLGRDSSQMRWLRARIRGRGTCTLAFWHRPRYSAGRHGDQADVAPLWDAVRSHAALVLNGHDHDMQVLHARPGPTILVSGAGGHSHYAVHRQDPRLAWANDRDDGAVRLSLHPGVARFAFVASDGRVLHRGSVPCRR